ncbi:heterocyst differentiation related protein [Brunnivagina elsteri]|uniref:Heterocyst differentiation related protein n=1 Tax=Brunnivagina elsteri CCALA 953 TaxID=987040 RepID=A0A2A2TAG3_9CYAN|nr:heterocyst differentiation related protein [Calothrix elsteri]PAX48286.1 heterocyst differentiation related protein [Calothrix elsteri CCALA 953]
MSESMAFIGGVAVAGLAALVLLKGTVNPAQTGFTAVAPQIQAPIVAPQVMPQQFPYGYPGQPVLPNTVPNVPNDQFRLDLERKMENIQRENEVLRKQYQESQSQLVNLNNQFQAQALQSQNNQRAQLQQSQSPWWSSGIVWAVGGIALTVGGGIVFAGVSALFSQKQRPVRTVQVIHPYTGPTPPLAPTTRRAEFLPPRVDSSRRVESHEYDDVY